MLQKSWSALKKESGFTLIELMVVVVIIAVLVAIAIPIFTSATQSAKLNTCKANLRTLDGAISVYYSENSAYPPTVSALTSGYLKAVPTEPFQGAYGLNAASSSATCTRGHTY
ncbi:MAG: prepilin-type N-terminal cleavage/methylation domain-containing protein [Actinobacteria bacterium]|nr:prepilin-type N-terminal cleavage/methylation domain-containing protein [Actinomycetota bacterium]